VTDDHLRYAGTTFENI